MVIRSFPPGSVLPTSTDVIDAVGGTAAAAKLTASSMGSVSNWRKSGRLPPATFLEFACELAARELRAPPTLWGIRRPTITNWAGAVA